LGSRSLDLHPCYVARTPIRCMAQRIVCMMSDDGAIGCCSVGAGTAAQQQAELASRLEAWKEAKRQKAVRSGRAPTNWRGGPIGGGGGGCGGGGGGGGGYGGGYVGGYNGGYGGGGGRGSTAGFNTNFGSGLSTGSSRATRSVASEAGTPPHSSWGTPSPSGKGTPTSGKERWRPKVQGTPTKSDKENAQPCGKECDSARSKKCTATVGSARGMGGYTSSTPRRGDSGGCGTVSSARSRGSAGNGGAGATGKASQPSTPSAPGSSSRAGHGHATHAGARRSSAACSPDADASKPDADVGWADIEEMYSFDLAKVESMVRIHSELGFGGSVDGLVSAQDSPAARPRPARGPSAGAAAVRLGLPARPASQRGTRERQQASSGGQPQADLARSRTQSALLTSLD